jgi:hypothetical protein
MSTLLIIVVLILLLGGGGRHHLRNGQRRLDDLGGRDEMSGGGWEPLASKPRISVGRSG